MDPSRKRKQFIETYQDYIEERDRKVKGRRLNFDKTGASTKKTMVRRTRTSRKTRKASRRGYKKTRYSYGTRRRFGFRRRRFGGRRILKKHQYATPMLPLSIVKKIHIPCSIKVSRFAKKVYTAGQKHLMNWFINGYTSTISGNNPLSFRFHADIGARMFLNGGWVGTPTVPSGVLNSYSLAYPQATRYLLKGIRIKIMVKQFNEVCRMRFSLARMTRAAAGSPSLDRLWGWNSNIDEPQNVTYWNTLWQKYLKFDDPLYIGSTGSGYTNNRQKEVNMYVPFNRVFETSKRAQAAGAVDWEPAGAQWWDFTYLIIDSNDNSSGDSRFCEVNVFMQAIWYEME